MAAAEEFRPSLMNLDYYHITYGSPGAGFFGDQVQPMVGCLLR